MGTEFTLATSSCELDATLDERGLCSYVSNWTTQGGLEFVAVSKCMGTGISGNE